MGQGSDSAHCLLLDLILKLSHLSAHHSGHSCESFLFSSLFTSEEQDSARWGGCPFICLFNNYLLSIYWGQALFPSSGTPENKTLTSEALWPRWGKERE